MDNKVKGGGKDQNSEDKDLEEMIDAFGSMKQPDAVEKTSAENFEVILSLGVLMTCASVWFKKEWGHTLAKMGFIVLL